MRVGFRPSLGHLFLVSVFGLAVLLCLLFYVLLRGAEDINLKAAARLRAEIGQDVAHETIAFLSQASDEIDDFQRRLDLGLVDLNKPESLESDFFGRLVANERLSELTLTFATKKDFGADGLLELNPEGRAQWSVFRMRDEAGAKDGAVSERIVTRRVEVEHATAHAWLKARTPGAGLQAGTFVPEAAGEDPTKHPSFWGVTKRAFFDRAAWSDLHRTPLDAALPPERRRMVLTVQRAFELKDNRIAVLRVGLVAEELDRLTQLRAEHSDDDPHRVFLVNAHGGVMTRFKPGDAFIETNDDFRLDAEHIPPEVAAAISSPTFKELASKNLSSTEGRFELNGANYQVSFRGLGAESGFSGGLGDWSIGVVVPEAYYLKDLMTIQTRVMLVSLAVMAVILLGGWWTLRLVRKDLNAVVKVTARMREFDFQPSDPPVALRDAGEVLDGLEHAKTAMRALGKYAPLSLVKQLYQARIEPKLGGEKAVATILFSDIKDFTTLSEQLTPDALAQALGVYLEAMTTCVHEYQGVIDKYIGDAVMALWNIPAPVADHPNRACAAALACVERTGALFASGAWKSLPPWVTRFGLHTDTVMAGHYGSPERMNYTALGDGVNLASRLEGLNKVYGTTILVSEQIQQAARERYAFRLLDLVAVKGRMQALRVYELLGPAGQIDSKRAERAANYEAAFELYRARDFAGAQALLGAQVSTDYASRMLSERCKDYIEEAPLQDWNGVFTAKSK